MKRKKRMTPEEWAESIFRRHVNRQPSTSRSQFFHGDGSNMHQALDGSPSAPSTKASSFAPAASTMPASSLWAASSRTKAGP